MYFNNNQPPQQQQPQYHNHGQQQQQGGQMYYQLQQGGPGGGQGQQGSPQPTQSHIYYVQGNGVMGSSGYNPQQQQAMLGGGGGGVGSNSNSSFSLCQQQQGGGPSSPHYIQLAHQMQQGGSGQQTQAQPQSGQGGLHIGGMPMMMMYQGGPQMQVPGPGMMGQPPPPFHHQQGQQQQPHYTLNVVSTTPDGKASGVTATTTSPPPAPATPNTPSPTSKKEGPKFKTGQWVRVVVSARGKSEIGQLKSMNDTDGSATVTTMAGYDIQIKQSQLTRVFLIVLDLNGVLVHRSKGKSITTRPHVEDFLQFLFKNFVVAVWTSCIETNGQAIIAKVFDETQRHRMVFQLFRDACTPNPTPENKYGTIKDLSHIWEKFPDSFNVENTVIIDDSPEKCSHPMNAFCPMSFDKKADGDDNLPQLIELLKEVIQQDSMDPLRTAQSLVPPPPRCLDDDIEDGGAVGRKSSEPATSQGRSSTGGSKSPPTQPKETGSPGSKGASPQQPNSPPPQRGEPKKSPPPPNGTPTSASPPATSALDALMAANSVKVNRAPMGL